MKYPKPSAFLGQLGNAMLLLAMPLLMWVAAGQYSLIEIDPDAFVVLHAVAEGFAVIVSIMVFITGYQRLQWHDEGEVGQGFSSDTPAVTSAVWLGVLFLGVGLLDSLHALTYPGMPQLWTPNTHQKQLIFWLAARWLAAVALLLYVLQPPHRPLWPRTRTALLLGVLTCVASLGMAGLLWPDWFPTLFQAGHGCTPVKLWIEWGAAFLHLLTLLLLAQRQRKGGGPSRDVSLAYAVTLSLVSELLFSLPGNSVDSTFWGHTYKALAYLFLLRVMVDVSLRRPLEQLRDRHAREHATLTAAPDGIMWVNEDGRIVMVNPALLELSGYAAQELIGQPMDLLIAPSLRSWHAERVRDYFRQPHPRPMLGTDIRLCRRDGQLVPVDVALGCWHDSEGNHAIAYIRDRREQEAFVATLRHQATHDALTGLPNRLLFETQLAQALARASRLHGQVAVLLLDLDNFKTINDTFGHAAGDGLLVQVARRLRAMLRSADVLARLGGDEFAVLLTDLTHPDEAVHVALKILADLQAPFGTGAHQLITAASIGIAFGPQDADDVATMLRYADIAMYRAKQQGRGTYVCYSADMDRNLREDIQLHARLKQAIEEQLLMLYYQPQIDMRDGRILGVEALLRWQDPQLGAVSPARFIPIAEATA